MIEHLAAHMSCNPHNRQNGAMISRETVLNRLAPSLPKGGVEVVKPPRTRAMRKILLAWTGAVAPTK